MKLTHISLAAIAAVAGNAQALTPAVALNEAGGTVVIYSAGASANRNVIGGIFTQNCATSIDVYYSSNAAGGDFTSDAANGDSHRVYTCKLKPAATVDAEFVAFADKNVSFFKRDAGGSGIGVANIAVGTADALDLSTGCTATGNVFPVVPQYTCTKKAANKPLYLGFSDVEPALFKGINTPAGFNSGGTNTAGFTITTLYETIFGVAVNNQLRNALQLAQGLSVGATDEANRPSVPKSVIGSIVRGELQDPAGGLGWQALGVANPDRQINICRRAPGSGTQAAANLYFAGFPCNTPAGAVATNLDSGLPNTLTGNFSGNPIFVYEGGSTGNVISCLNNADAVAGTYAIGHVSAENVPRTSGATIDAYSLVKIDGVSPTRANATAGRYDYVFELTAQYKNANLTGIANNGGNFVKAFVAAAQTTANLDKIGGSAVGITALPAAGAYNATANQSETASPRDLTRFNTRMTRNGNSCTPYSVVQ